ncbi:MAG: Uma2 family endonuclease [Planctomycetaceae bacterium]|nr:Uma2 family endonuclease [Planctomycetaceae bacterium]
MVTVSHFSANPISNGELHNGDRFSREEFHRVYAQMPKHFQAELIGGIVYVASPLRRRHGTNHLPLGTLFFTYEARTPGVECADNTTVLLGEDSEPQPDLLLRILPDHGGQSTTTEDDYIAGPPELVAEIAHSSRALDLHAKREDYRRYGVQEYLVLCLQENELRWFNLASNEERTADEEGIIRLETFPGLWIHAESLLAKGHSQMMSVLEEGLASEEHAAFAKQLADAKS